jgi:hypothetical protein
MQLLYCSICSIPDCMFISIHDFFYGAARCHSSLLTQVWCTASVASCLLQLQYGHLIYNSTSLGRLHSQKCSYSHDNSHMYSWYYKDTRITKMQLFTWHQAYIIRIQESLHQPHVCRTCCHFYNVTFCTIKNDWSSKDENTISSLRYFGALSFPALHTWLITAIME